MKITATDPSGIPTALNISGVAFVRAPENTMTTQTEGVKAGHTAEDHCRMFREKHPNASPGGVARDLILSLGAYGGSPNMLWLLSELRDEAARASFDRMMILSDFKDSDPGGAAVAEHDSFLRQNPHLAKAQGPSNE